jgi:hypothetical protein
VSVSGPTTLHAGDRVLISTTLSTNDENENGEGEPLQVSINGTQFTTVFTYGATSTIEHLASKDETITASIPGEDGDEDGTVVIKLINGQRQAFSQQEKDAFNRLSAEENLEAARWAKASAKAALAGAGSGVLAVLTGPSGIGPAFFGGAAAGFTLDAAAFGYLSAQAWEASAEYQKLALDPPDPNFTTVAEPVIQPLTLSLQPTNTALAPQVAAFNALFLNGQTEISVERALYTAVNRASTAQQAGDQASLALQEQAITRFSRQLGDTLNARPALLTAAQKAAVSLGGSLTATPSDVMSFETNVHSNGLPASIQQTLRLTGATDADIASFTTLAMVQDTTAVAGDPVALLTDPQAVSLFQSASAALHTGGAKVSTPGVFDPGTATWYLRSQNSAGAPDAGKFAYGAPGWVPFVGDWTGSGQTGIGVFDPATATWYLRNEAGPGGPDAGRFQFGAPGWIPIVGEWTGSGHTGIGVFDPATATFYLRNEAGPGAPDAGKFAYGAPHWVPLAGDWTGSGQTGIGVFDPATATFYLRNEAGPGAPDAGKFAYGAPGWLPLVGDWTGSGEAGIGVFDPGTATFYLRNETSAGGPDAGKFAYGAPSWVPLGGNFVAASATATPAALRDPLGGASLSAEDLLPAGQG